MVNCFVPGCRSGRGRRKAHMFRAPPKALDKWKEVLRKVRKDKEYSSANKNHKLCSLHFEERYIIKVNKFLIRGEWVELPRLKWTLEPDAVPTIFDGGHPSWRGTARGEEVEDAEADGEYEPEPEVKKTVKSYQAKKGPRRGASRYTVGTKGKCFMCWGPVIEDNQKATSGSNAGGAYSLKKLASYLEIDLGKIFGPASNIPPKSSSSSSSGFTTPIQNGVKVWLCGKCAGGSNALTEMLKELEMLQNRVTTSLRTLSSKLMHAKKLQQASLGSNSSSSEPGPPSEAEIKLREELISKCSSHQFTRESLPEGTSTWSQSPGHKQEVEFIYQVVDEDEHEDYGRFKEEDLFLRQNDLELEPDSNVKKGPDHCLPLPVTPESDSEVVDDDQEEEMPIPSEDSSTSSKKLKCSHCRKTFRYEKHLTNHEAICTTKVIDPLSTPTPTTYDPDQELGKSCPYCDKTYELQCNIRLHVLNKHRLKIFRQYFPAGSAKSLVLSKVREVINEYKELKGGQFKCSYCPRKFTKKDVELLVIQNHTLLTHFTEIVTKLKGNMVISDDEGEDVKDVKIEVKSESDSDSSVTAMTPPSPLPEVKLEPVEDVEDDDVCFLEVVPPKRSRR